MNPELPIGRLEQVQQVLQAAYIVTDREHREMALQIVPEHRILWMEELMETDENQTLLSERRKRAIDTAPLYANFTSGSTGRLRVWLSVIGVFWILLMFLRNYLALHQKIGLLTRHLLILMFL